MPWQSGPLAITVGDHSNHVAFTSVDAADTQAAIAQLPPLMRDKAQITEIGQFTAEQVKSYH